MRVPDRLIPLLEDGLIEEVIRPLMSGKEADVYLVAAREGICVAKVYKEAQNRSFRQRAAYTEGRVGRNSRQRRAMEKNSKYGREQNEAAWQNAEVDALYKLGSAGVRVPRPHVYAEGVLVMDLVRDEDGGPAPRLCDCSYTPDQALNAFRFVVAEVVKMLCAGLIHGDLSEYNVLLAHDGPVIIDFPQAVDAARNGFARNLLVRDVTNLARFFARSRPGLEESRFGEEMWALYERAELHPESELTGHFRGSNRKADTRAVLREVEAAAKDAARRRR